ncbi:translocase of outer mitochondrial membrane [Entomortierella chlamydospora]|uniref:Translocase of outer mitochondrial membrane n=1 Tax=Entomortierella chlamydospora TaxID=101097 RepID=A0A9P6MZJ2_9FUNG|nr:translocase of outer mitochondrial membrane [Entomortierella chlamydospora]KAG0019029.1 translocase of outer mitochondrial membrane [Entomortierella chlamydospora]
MAASPLKTPFGFNPTSPIPAPAVPVEAAPSDLLGQVKDAFAKVNKFRDDLNLPHPGTYEGVNREVRNTFLNNQLFDGARCDITKVLTPNFQVTHSFAMGSVGAPSSYNFGTAFIGQQSFLSGNLDTDGNVQARANYAWSNTNVSKVQAQLSTTPGHSMLQVEQDYNGQDFNINIKGVNPSPVEGTGIFIGSYLQSVTKNVSLGVEAVHQRPTPDQRETIWSYVAKYTGNDYIATAQYQGFGALQASYYLRYSEKVDFGTEIQLVTAGGRREAIATVGGKFEFRRSTFRGQVDTTGKVSAVLEEKIVPGFSFLVSGEMDHGKGQSRFGVGMMWEV